MGNFVGKAMDDNMEKQQKFMLEMNRYFVGWVFYFLVLVMFKAYFSNGFNTMNFIRPQDHRQHIFLFDECTN